MTDLVQRWSLKQFVALSGTFQRRQLADCNRLCSGVCLWGPLEKREAPAQRAESQESFSPLQTGLIVKKAERTSPNSSQLLGKPSFCVSSGRNRTSVTQGMLQLRCTSQMPLALLHAVAFHVGPGGGSVASRAGLPMDKCPIHPLNTGPKENHTLHFKHSPGA